MKPAPFGAGALAGLVFFTSVASSFATRTSAASDARPGDDDATGWKAERITVATATAGAESALPAELLKKLPEAFAKLLDPAGIRLLGKDGKPRCELWLRAQLPLIAKPPATMGVQQASLAPGEFVAVLRTFGGTTDYRDQEIAAGIYGLRYSQQPSDGNHLGTSDSRDFLVLTSFDHDHDPAPIATQEELIKLAVPVSPSDHALCLYVAPAPADAPKDDAPRFFERGEKKEWALELVLSAKPQAAPAAPDSPAAPKLPSAPKSPSETAPEQVRLAVVLFGHTAG